MKNYFYLLFLVFMGIGSKGFGQCPPSGSLSFNTQLEVDNFLINYPNCTEIIGDLEIGIFSTNLISNLSSFQNLTSISGNLSIYSIDESQNLSGLDNLISIGGDLNISSNQNLQNLNGLGSLSSLDGDFVISNNINLQNLNGLESLNSIGGALSIRHNNLLLNLSGLDNLLVIDRFLLIDNNDNLQNLNGLGNLSSIADYLEIFNNDNLQNLNGLENLNSIGDYLSISSNSNLLSLDGLDNLIAIGGTLRIKFNDQLSDCSAYSICYYLVTTANSIFISNNDPGCNNLMDIVSQCADLPSIRFFSYYDLNQNAIQDLGEPLSQNANVLITPGDYGVYGNAAFGGIKYLGYGDYSVSLNENDIPNWELTNDIPTYNITLDSININDTLSFGLYPSSFQSNLYTGCINSQPRCNEIVLFQPLVVNQGSTIAANGTLWFDIDPEVLEITFIDVPDSLDGSHRVGWHYTNLYPGQTFKKGISLQLPGPPDFPVGDFLYFATQTNYVDENGIQNERSNPHNVEVRCSFDPNDKLVAPQYPNNYALIDENLIYTIRFQNTGNAEAYDVVITDELDSNLDLSTFQYITSSHESVLSTFLEGNMLSFEFRDIFLPDSTTNFDGSQGYVMYSIKTNSDIDESTKIENTANIFFDFNPAVVTNTTENLMVSSFDFDEDGFDIWEDCDDNNVLVNTDAVEIPNNGIDEDCDGEDFTTAAKDILTIQARVFPNPTSGLLEIVFPTSVEGTYEIRDLTGKLLLQSELNKETSVNLKSQPNGVYILLLKTNNGVWAERILKL